MARLVHEIEVASWFLTRRSLPPGLASDRKTPLGVANLIRFEQFNVSDTSGSAGGHDSHFREEKDELKGKNS
jgi:hypothetical protein